VLEAKNTLGVMSDICALNSRQADNHRLQGVNNGIDKEKDERTFFAGALPMELSVSDAAGTGVSGVACTRQQIGHR
jgi:hypothetical protein